VRVRVLEVLSVTVVMLMEVLEVMLIDNVLSASKVEVLIVLVDSIVAFEASSSELFGTASVVSKFSPAEVGNKKLSSVLFSKVMVVISYKDLVVPFVSIFVFEEVLLARFVQFYAMV
jgi:hypothetical protein